MENEPVIVPVDIPVVIETHEEETSSKKPERLPKIWMNFDDFCTCFTSIVVFHNPRDYQYNHKHTEIKFTPYQPVIMHIIELFIFGVISFLAYTNSGN